MRSFALWVACGLCAGFAGGLPAQTAAPPAGSSTAAAPPAQGASAPKRQISWNDPTGISQASSIGDQDKLNLVASQTSNGPDVIAKALQQRSLYQLDLSSKTAESCADTVKATHSPGNLQCVFVLAGNHLLQNDFSAWAKLMQTVKTTAYPNYLDATGKLLHQDPATLQITEFEVSPDYPPFFNVPAVAVVRHDASFDMPLHKEPASADGQGSVYTTSVTINGTVVQMVFDTSAPMVLLGADDAKKLDIDPIYPNWMRLPDGSYASLGIVKHMELGGVTLSNMPVGIASKPLAWKPLLGLSAIRYLDAFRFDGNTVHSVADGFSDCTTPMDMASNVNGTDPVFVVRGRVDGQPFPFVVSTGSPGSINRSHYGQPEASAAAKPYTAYSPFGTEYAWYAMGHAKLQIGNGPEGDQPFQVIYRAEHTRFRYYLGAGYFAQHPLVADFKRGMMCVK